MKNIKPLLSILIPTWGRCESVEKLINSSGVQGNPEVEFVVVDNNSSDDIFQCLEKVSKSTINMRLYRNAKNIGMVGNWNKCVQHSKGEWLLLMCSDDAFKAKRVVEILTFIKNNITTPSLILQDESSVIPINKKQPGPKTVRSINLPIASGNIWHRSITEKLGEFDNRLEYSPDAEFWYRIAQFYPVYIVNQNIAVYQRNDTSYMWKTWEKDDFINQIEIISRCNSRYGDPDISDTDIRKNIKNGVWNTYMQILGDTLATKRQYIFNKYIFEAIKEVDSLTRFYELLTLLLKKAIINSLRWLLR
jgi:glycosyltransferase involved in cell wall biosynthesis